MNFAPYQDNDPENERSSPQSQSPHPPGKQQGSLPNPGAFEDDVERDGDAPRGATDFGNGGGGADERNVDVYSTSLPMRLDFLAALAYVLLPPAGPAMLLVFEHKNDYVRYVREGSDAKSIKHMTLDQSADQVNQVPCMAIRTRLWTSFRMWLHLTISPLTAHLYADHTPHLLLYQGPLLHVVGR